jgi:predicted transcriptional regulator
MRSSIQARLDPESQKALERLAGRLGWSPSKIVREGIRLLESCYGQSAGQRIAGLGKFSSGIRDLGSNKRHLKGFGQ